MAAFAEWLSPRALRITIGVVAMFVIAAFRYGARLSTLVVGCWLVGYLVEFHVFRSVVALARRTRPLPLELGLATLGLVGTIVLAYYNMAPVLLLTLGCWFLIDVLVLRFR